MIKTQSNMKTLMTIGLIALLASCSEQKKSPAAESTDMTEMNARRAMAVDSSLNKYTPDMVVNKKDYSCGMPVSAGISDTCHYKGKAYGFCSKECKEEFLKDPDKVLAIMDGK